MLVWILGALAFLLLFHLLLVAAVAEFAIHPPAIRRTCDTDSMALHVAAAFGATPELVTMQSADGIKLSAWWLRLPNAVNTKAVLMCHGVADTAFGIMGAALLYLRNGYSVLAPDNRGHGNSGGFVTYGVRESADIAAWQKWLSEQGVEDCSGFGQSLGASSLLQSLQQGARFSSIVAECPFSTFERVAQDRVRAALTLLLPGAFATLFSNVWVAEVLFYLRLLYGIDLKQARPVDAVLNADVEILLVHGTADLETPIHHSYELASRNSAMELWPVPGAKHTGAYAVASEEFESRVLACLGKRVRPPAVR